MKKALSDLFSDNQTFTFDDPPYLLFMRQHKEKCMVNTWNGFIYAERQQILILLFTYLGIVTSEAR